MQQKKVLYKPKQAHKGKKGEIPLLKKGISCMEKLKL
jgi:hypothetical protein